MNLETIAANLQPSPDGTWITGNVSAVSYPEAGNELCFDIEDHSFWFRHRNGCISAVVQRYPPGGLFLDVGGGNGYVAQALQASGIEVALVEPGAVGARNAVQRGVRNVICSALEDIEFRPGVVAGAGLFDVLEHIADDAGFLRGIHRLLAPGGRLFLTVPAYPWLWSREDDLAGHCRRYTRDSLRRVVETAGLRVEFATYFFRFLVPAIAAVRVLPYRLGADRRTTHATSHHKDPNGLAGAFLEKLMRQEAGDLRRGKSAGFGASCLLVARKPQ